MKVNLRNTLTLTTALAKLCVKKMETHFIFQSLHCKIALFSVNDIFFALSICRCYWRNALKKTLLNHDCLNLLKSIKICAYFDESQWNTVTLPPVVRTYSTVQYQCTYVSQCHNAFTVHCWYQLLMNAMQQENNSHTFLTHIVPTFFMPIVTLLQIV